MPIVYKKRGRIKFTQEQVEKSNEKKFSLFLN